jgi:hypothetical protein
VKPNATNILNIDPLRSAFRTDGRRSVALVHGDLARDAMANSARALQDGRIEPIEELARKRG